MRVLLSAHSAATRYSFGTVCREIWKRLVRAEPRLEVVQHGWQHSPLLESVPWTIIPARGADKRRGEGFSKDPADEFGDVSFERVVRSFKPDVVWHLGDPYMGMEPSRLKERYGYKLIYHYPPGYEPFNLYRRDWIEKLQAADLLVSATRFGSEVLEAIPELEGRSIPHIHLGVDTSLFHRLPAPERRALRREIGGDIVGSDTLILGWVGNDQVRKQVWKLFEIMYYLKSGAWIGCADCGRITVREYDANRRQPRETGRLRMYPADYDYRHCSYCLSRRVHDGVGRNNVLLWTVMDNDLSVGYDLRMLADMYQVGRLVFGSERGKRGHTFAEMNLLYNSMDILLYPSGAEGFGLPVLEAMACGVPAVYSNYSGHAEFAVGLPVRTNFVPDAPDPSMMAVVDTGDALCRILQLVDNAPLRRRLSRQALARARKMSWEAFSSRWLELLAQCHPA